MANVQCEWVKHKEESARLQLLLLLLHRLCAPTLPSPPLPDPNPTPTSNPYRPQVNPYRPQVNPTQQSGLGISDYSTHPPPKIMPLRFYAHKHRTMHNALDHQPTAKTQPFPSNHPAPPAHLGTRQRGRLRGGTSRGRSSGSGRIGRRPRQCAGGAPHRCAHRGIERSGFGDCGLLREQRWRE